MAQVFIFILMGTYLSYLCEGLETDIKGYYFGIGLFFYGFSNLVTGLLTLVADGIFGPNAFMLLMMLINFIAGILGFCAVENKPGFTN